MRVLVLCALIAAMFLPEAQAAEPKRYTMLPGGGYVVSYPTALWQGSFKVSRRTSNAPVAVAPFDPKACAEVRLDAWAGVASPDRARGTAAQGNAKMLSS